MLVSKVRERDLVGNRVPEEMTAAQARLEELSDRTVQEALRWFDDDSEELRRGSFGGKRSQWAAGEGTDHANKESNHGAGSPFVPQGTGEGARPPGDVGSWKLGVMGKLAAPLR
ncbi:hypothetical protein EDB80DRAFT_742207 [Ilyonectria destructans]|nr:hypothetical protein EDB80DRAFT_742207 [Ilyonectria destructans]